MMKRLAQIAACLMASLAICGSALAQSVGIEFDATKPQVRYAADQLASALSETGHQLAAPAEVGDFRITLTEDDDGLAPEAYVAASAGNVLSITGGDGRGVIYGALAVAEQLRNGSALPHLRRSRGGGASVPRDQVQPAMGLLSLELRARPALRHRARRALLGGLSRHDGREPLQRADAVEPAPVSLHDQGAELPRSQPFTDAELAEWRKLYQAIFAMAKARGIDTYLVNWNILVSPEFAAAHDLEGQTTIPTTRARRRDQRARQALHPRKRDPSAGGISRPDRLRLLVRRADGGHDPAASGRTGSTTRSSPACGR